ncbi:hypothetical protein T484DRAFT_1843271 [Baffinella frigidus]|nr:hypothetical protein T484DRAFT_1843271 [Cryptophyta sp. CCMP2293]
MVPLGPNGPQVIGADCQQTSTDFDPVSKSAGPNNTVIGADALPPDFDTGAFLLEAARSLPGVLEDVTVTRVDANGGTGPPQGADGPASGHKKEGPASGQKEGPASGQKEGGAGDGCELELWKVYL